MFKERDPLALAQELAAGASNDLDKELALADGKTPEAAPEKVASDNTRKPLKITPVQQDAPAAVEVMPVVNNEGSDLGARAKEDGKVQAGMSKAALKTEAGVPGSTKENPIELNERAEEKPEAKKEEVIVPEQDKVLAQAEEDALRADTDLEDSMAARGVSPQSGKSIWEEVWEKHHPGENLEAEPKAAPGTPKSGEMSELEALYYGKAKPVSPDVAPEKVPVEAGRDKTENAAEGKFVVPEKFERPEYDKAKKEWDGLSRFIKSKGLDPEKYGFDYKAIFRMEPSVSQPGEEIGALEVFESYHDYLNRLQNLTEEEKKWLDTGWESSTMGKWSSPAVFSSGMNLDKPESELYPYRDEIWNMMNAQRTGEAQDFYAEAVKNGQIEEIGRPENKEALPIEQLKQAVDKARAEYIQAEADAKRVDKSASKLSQLRAYLFSGKKEGAEDKKESGVKKDKKETEKFNEEKRKIYEEAKKVLASGLYDEKIKSYEEKIKTGELTPEKQREALAELKFEVIRATILDEKKTFNEAKIAALPEKERGLCMKAMARYGQLPQWSKIMISAGAATGATLAFSSGVGFAAIGGIYAWKALRAGVGTTAGLLAGKGYSWVFDKIADTKNIKSKGELEIINEIKGGLIGMEDVQNIAGNKFEKNEEEFEKWFSQMSASTNQKLDKLATKEKRILLGKAIGQGVVIAGVAGLTSWGMEKGMASLSPDLAAKMGIRVSAPPEKAPKGVTPDNFDSRYTAQKGVAPGDNFDSRFSAQKGVTPPALDNLETLHEKMETPLEPVEATKAAETIQTLKIGARGPEGAIIDNFRDNPKLAEAFGYDPDGKISLDNWAGTKAHQLWLKSVEEELSKPGMAEKLTAQGFTADADGYAKAMYKIGKGSVEIAPTGEVQLTDNASFLRNVAQSVEGQQKIYIEGPDTLEVIKTPTTPELPIAKVSVAEVPTAPEVLTPEVLTPEASTADPLLGANGLKLKEVVNRLVEPEILKDATFKAGAKVPLGKILAEIPPEAYEDKYALSRYWHSLSGPGVHTPDLPGTGFMKDLSYDDFRKYSEMAKFLRENAGTGVAERLKDMTVEDFLKTYGSDLGKGVKGQISGNLSGAVESIPSAKANILQEPAPGVKNEFPEPIITDTPPAKELTGIVHEAEGAQEAATVANKTGNPALEKALLAANVTPEKQAIMKGIIDSASPGRLKAMSLVGEIEAGKVSADDAANYYAQAIKNTNGPAATLSSGNMANLKRAFSTAANGSGIQKVNSLKVISAMLERLKQGK